MKKAIIYKAGELYKLGYNSSQAVCGALAGYYGLDQETAFKWHRLSATGQAGWRKPAAQPTHW